MKTIVVPIASELKAKLDCLQRRGLTINGFVHSVLGRALGRPHDLNAEHLTKRDIRKIEEAMNCDDLEQMVAVVDELVRKTRKAA
jgi:hypothetical protein